MFSSWPDSAFVDVKWLRQAAALDEPRRESHAADRARLAIFLPARAGQIAADHALDRHDLGLADQAGAAIERPAIDPGGQVHPVHVGGDQVVRLAEQLEPKAAIWLSTRPLSGIPVGRTQSKALIRSVLTRRSRSPSHKRPHLAAADRNARQTGLEHDISRHRINSLAFLENSKPRSIPSDPGADQRGRG